MLQKGIKSYCKFICIWSTRLNCQPSNHTALPAPDTTWPHPPAWALFLACRSLFLLEGCTTCKDRGQKAGRVFRNYCWHCPSASIRDWPAPTPSGGIRGGTGFTLAPGSPKLDASVHSGDLLHYWCFPVSRCFFLLPNKVGALASTPLSGELNLRKHLIS